MTLNATIQCLQQKLANLEDRRAVAVGLLEHERANNDILKAKLLAANARIAQLETTKSLEHEELATKLKSVEAEIEIIQQALEEEAAAHIETEEELRKYRMAEKQQQKKARKETIVESGSGITIKTISLTTEEKSGLNVGNAVLPRLEPDEYCPIRTPKQEQIFRKFDRDAHKLNYAGALYLEELRAMRPASMPTPPERIVAEYGGPAQGRSLEQRLTELENHVFGRSH